MVIRAFAVLAVVLAAGQSLGLECPKELTTEYRKNPVGIDADRPRLSWKLPVGTIGQSAYELEFDGVAQGRVESGDSLNVAWNGAVLGTGERHSWRVRVWNQDGVASDWSKPAEFTTGVMRDSDWKAKWIAGNRITRPDEDFGTAEWITAPVDANGEVVLKYEFEFDGAKPEDVVEMVHAGVSQHRIQVNGKDFHRFTGHVHDWRYVSFRDMTQWLVKGKNVVSVRVFADDARPEPYDHIRKHARKDVRAFIAKIVFPDGRVIKSGKGWKSPNGTVSTLGTMREPDFGKEMILRTETASPSFAKTFNVARKVKSAVLHVTGVGFYEAWLNGRKIGRKVLDPSPTDFSKRVLYSTYRLDDQLKVGENELKLLVGHGWYDVRSVLTWNFDTAPWRNFPRAIAQLDMVYENGERATVVTDGSWRQVESEVGYDDIFEGEVIGSRNPRGPDFAATKLNAEEVPGPGGKLVAESMPGAEIVREIEPKSIHPIGDGAYVLEFPESISGWLRLKIRGRKRGDLTVIRYDERINDDFTPATPSDEGGLRPVLSVYGSNAEKGGEKRTVDAYFRYSASHRVCPVDAGMQTDRFVSAGLPEETYEPRFVYHGFRYVLIKGLSETPRIGDAVACEVRTAFEKIGSFECSDAIFNRLMAMTDCSYRCNFTDGIPTDCPHREKNGWTGDAHVASELAQYCYENTAAYENWLKSICDAQLPDGNVPAIVPTSGWGFAWGNGPGWDCALAVIPWNLWMYRGDRSALDSVYPSLVKLVQFCQAQQDVTGLVNFGLPDWIPVNHRHRPARNYTSSCYFYLIQRIASEIAKIKGIDDDAAKFAAGAEKTRAGIRHAFYKGYGFFDNGEQTAQSCALTFGLVNGDAERAEVEAQLIKAVEAANGHVDVGLYGMKHVFRALSVAGRTDLAFKMLTNPTDPSPAKWAKEGSPALWEEWFSGASRCHIMFGDFAAWAYQFLAGIRLAPGEGSTLMVPLGKCAFSKILLAPQVIDDLDFVKASVNTPYGEVKSSWKRSNGKVAYRFVVPAGASAEIKLPGKAPKEVVAGEYQFED